MSDRYSRTLILGPALSPMTLTGMFIGDVPGKEVPGCGDAEVWDSPRFTESGNDPIFYHRLFGLMVNRHDRIPLSHVSAHDGVSWVTKSDQRLLLTGERRAHGLDTTEIIQRFDGHPAPFLTSITRNIPFTYSL